MTLLFLEYLLPFREFKSHRSCKGAKFQILEGFREGVKRKENETKKPYRKSASPSRAAWTPTPSPVSYLMFTKHQWLFTSRQACFPLTAEAEAHSSQSTLTVLALGLTSKIKETSGALSVRFALRFLF